MVCVVCLGICVSLYVGEADDIGSAFERDRVTFWGPVRRMFAVVSAVEVTMQWDLGVFKRLG